MTSQHLLKLIIEAAEASACTDEVVGESGYETLHYIHPDLFIEFLKKHLT